MSGFGFAASCLLVLVSICCYGRFEDISYEILLLAAAANEDISVCLR